MWENIWEKIFNNEHYIAKSNHHTLGSNNDSHMFLLVPRVISESHSAIREHSRVRSSFCVELVFNYMHLQYPILCRGSSKHRTLWTLLHLCQLGCSFCMCFSVGWLSMFWTMDFLELPILSASLGGFLSCWMGYTSFLAQVVSKLRLAVGVQVWSEVPHHVRIRRLRII